MQTDNFVSKQYSQKILHPLLLTDLNIIHSNHKSAIMPQLKNKKELSNTIDDFIFFKDNNKKDKIKTYCEIDELFQSDEYFLLSHFNISKIEDIYDMLKSLIYGKNHINTINYILNIIFSIFKTQFDDINIDKIVYLYIDLFKIYYDEKIIYSKIFNTIKDLIDDKETDTSIIHTLIVRKIIILK